MVIDKILLLLFAHFLGDSSLQTERQAMHKGYVPRLLISHCFVYSGIVSLILMFLGNYDTWKFIMLFCSHILIDQLLYTSKDVKKFGRIGWVDQGLHLIFLGVVMW